MKKIIFYTVFFLMFLCGGALNYFGIFSYKMIFGALLPLILAPFVKIKNNSFLPLILTFALVILLSAIVNKSSWLLTAWFSQNVIIPFLMFYVVSTYLSEGNIIKVYRWIILIACIQMPIIALQRFFYPVLTRFAAVEVADYDIGFGTFYTSDDTALSFFVIGVILFLLFDDAHNYFIKNKGGVLTWLAATILIMNSKLSYLILALIFAYYIISRRRIRTMLYLITMAGSLFVVAYFFGLRERIESNYGRLKEQLSFNVDPEQAEIFFRTAQGNRPAALLYLSSQAPKWLGEGPHALYNPILNKFNKGGDTSQLITFYVDIGLIGLIVSYVLTYSIIRSLQQSEFTRLYLIALILVSLVSNIFLDASIMMIFVIFCCSHLIPPKDAHEKLYPAADHLPNP